MSAPIARLFISPYDHGKPLLPSQTIGEGFFGQVIHRNLTKIVLTVVEPSNAFKRHLQLR